ncbi:hypothetical protein HanHA300_Chr12g0432241 [Helianthus annuus]|nr:hypothetical protein HanHA300_Chr12g0432241 [Helianthus annuus]KAJ0504217.1 hypothetical protein HanHA89_Chr12g0456881 [Helianthus annuus]KAJ0673922.1 hypothetical protein HanLR1_Chr12g0434331 [Helianthus annuus]
MLFMSMLIIKPRCSRDLMMSGDLGFTVLNGPSEDTYQTNPKDPDGPPEPVSKMLCLHLYIERSNHVIHQDISSQSDQPAYP